LHLAPLGVPLVVLAAVGFAHRWVYDDGFIYLRIVDQLLAGNGPVFNAGERVEAYTSPAWLAVLTVGDIVLPIRLEWIAVLLGLAAALAGVAAAMAGALRLAARPGDEEQRRRRWAVPVGALVLVAPMGLWVWWTSGLETGLTWAWLGASLFVLARWASDERHLGRGAAVLLGLGWLVRPELTLLSALFLAAVLAGEWLSTRWRARAGTVAWFVAVPVAYQIFRMGYFGLLVANTAIAKEGTSIRWDRGVSYLHDFVDPYWLWVPLAALLVAGYVPLLATVDRRRRLVAGAFLAGGLLVGLYAVAIGGDYLHGRFFVPVAFAICAPLAAVPLERRFVGLAAILPWAVITLLWLRPPFGTGSFLKTAIVLPQEYGGVTLDDVGWHEGGQRVAQLRERGLHIEAGYFGFRFDDADFELSSDLPTPAMLVGGIGAISYAAGPDVHVVDRLGLASYIGSHFEIAEGWHAPGHEKPAPPAWLAAQVAAPDADVSRDEFGVAAKDRDVVLEGPFHRLVADARRALSCGPLERLDDAARGHLGPRRFLRNIFRSPANTFLEIPRDPEEAVAELC
jgi:arabinofuranosyltransferase